MICMCFSSTDQYSFQEINAFEEKKQDTLCRTERKAHGCITHIPKRLKEKNLQNRYSCFFLQELLYGKKWVLKYFKVRSNPFWRVVVL